MPINNFSFDQLGGILVTVISVLGATITALWISMIVWAYRDMRKRSRDAFSHIMAALVVGLLNVPGLLVYLILRPQETLSEQYERALEEEALLQEIESRQACPGCGHSLQAQWRLCPYCHTRVRKLCDNCGGLLELAWNICPYCETAQVGTAEHMRQNIRTRHQTSEQDSRS